MGVVVRKPELDLAGSPLDPDRANKLVRHSAEVLNDVRVYFYAFPDGEPFVAFGVSFHPPVKPEVMRNLETLLGLGGTLLVQPFQNRLVCFFRLFLLDPMAAVKS